MRIRDFIGSPAGRCFARRLPVVMIVALAPDAAVAQQAPARQFSIEPQVRFEYDDNILRLPDGAASPAGYRRSDYRTSPSVAVNIVRPIGRQSVFLNGSVGYDFYRYNKQLERERISLAGGGQLSAGSCTAKGQVSYIRRQSDLDDIIIGGLGRGRNTETLWSQSVGVDCGSAGGISSGFSVTHDTVDNSDLFRKYGDFHANSYNAHIGLNRPAIGDVSLYANYRHGIYDNRFFAPGFNESVKSYAAGVRVDRQFGRIKGHISGGVTRVQSNTPGVRGFRGGTYDVSLTYLAPRLTATAGFGRSIQQSNLLGVDYSVVDSFDLGATYKVNPRISLNAGAGITRRRLSASPLAPVPLFGNRNDRSRIINVGATFEAARHISLDAGAIWRQRRGDLPIFDYNARILALTIRIH